MKKSGRIGLTLLLLIFLIAAVVFSFEENQKWVVEYLDSLNIKEKELLEIANFKGEELIFSNGRYISWDGESIFFMDQTGKVLWSKTFITENPRLLVDRSRIIVYSDSSGEILCFNNNGELLAEMNTENPVFNINVTEYGYIAHLKTEAGEELIFYDKSGLEYERIKFSEEFPLSYWQNEEGTFTVTVLTLKDKGFSTSLKEYTKEREETVISFEDEIILKTLTHGKKTLILTDEGVKMVKKDEIIWSKELLLVKDMILDGGEMYLLYGDNLEILDDKGETILKSTLALEYNRLHKHGKYIVLYGGRDMSIFLYREEVIRYTAKSVIRNIESQFNDLIVSFSDGVSVMRIEDIEEIKDKVQ